MASAAAAARALAEPQIKQEQDAVAVRRTMIVGDAYVLPRSQGEMGHRFVFVAQGTAEEPVLCVDPQMPPGRRVQPRPGLIDERLMSSPTAKLWSRPFVIRSERQWTALELEQACAVLRNGNKSTARYNCAFLAADLLSALFQGRMPSAASRTTAATPQDFRVVIETWMHDGVRPRPWKAAGEASQRFFQLGGTGLPTPGPPRTIADLEGLPDTVILEEDAEVRDVSQSAALVISLLPLTRFCDTAKVSVDGDHIRRV